MKNDLVIIAILLISIHLVVGYAGALIGSKLVRRGGGASLSGLAVFACGIAGALVAIALVLSALPYFVGLLAAPVFGGLAVVLWSNFRKS